MANTADSCWRGLVWVATLLSAGNVAAAGLGASWTGDIATVASGGLREGGRQMGLVELWFDHDFDALGREMALHATVQHTYGGGFSERYVGDLQTVSNIDADAGTRVLEAWVDIALPRGGSLLVGRYDLNSEFDLVDAASLFLSSSQGIGPEISQAGVEGPSIYPRTAAGARLQYERAGRILRGAVLDVAAPDPEDRSDAPFADGPLLAIEYEWPLDEARLTVGAWRFTRSQPTLSDPDQDAQQYGAYASIEYRVTPNLTTYLRLGGANADVCRIGSYAGGGIVYDGGLLPGREDSIGASIGQARNGSGYRGAMSAEGTAITSTEVEYELTWRIPFGEHLALQPDVQYVVNPGTRPDLRNALVLMLRVELTL